MPTKVQYMVGQRCGKEDNCKSTQYYEEDGFQYCKRGHLQEVNRDPSQLSLRPDRTVSSGYQRSKMRMILVPRAERRA